MKNFKFILLILTVVIFTFSCGSDTKSNNNTPTSEPTSTNSADTEKQQKSAPEKVIETVDSKPFQEKDMIYAWVDKLNIRDKASLKGKAITSVDSDDALEFTGTKSGKAETIVLRGVAYNDLFYKIVTKDGKEGWVYGGAVKRKREEKGNDPITDTKFDFPYFGSYDLSEWKKISSKSEGEETDITITTYQKGNQYLEVTKADRGEFYYGYDYKLMDKSKKILKERNFSFSVDMDLREISETVKDYTQSTPQQYSRTQKLDVHFYQLKPRPIMALGNWSVKPLMSLTTSNNDNSNSGKAVSISTLNYKDCNIPGKDSGCSCNFRVGKNYKTEEVFMTNFGKNGCITLSDATYALTGDFIKNGFDELYYNSEKEIWVELNEKGDDLLFGKKMDLGSDYHGAMNEIVKVLLVMPKFPNDLPKKMNGTVGMGHTANVKDLWNDALRKAKAERKKGNYGTEQEMVYKNDNYKISVKAKVIGKNDGGGKQYEGILEVADSNGKVLATKEVWGGCGC